MSKITFLGSASGQTPQYETVSFIIETNSKRRILVDTGPSVMKQLGRAGIATHMIDAVFITHCHGDHTLG